LRSVGVTDGDINNLIHDRHAREGISPARSALALESVRRAAGLPLYENRRAWQSRTFSRGKTREELASEYLRARGKDMRPVQPTPSTPPKPAPIKAASDSLLVPYGIDPEDNIVHAQDAVPGVPYSCPNCAAPLVLRAGAVKTHHFAHKADTACDGETLAHITAKLLIAKVIREYSMAASPILLQCSCEECRTLFDMALPLDAFSSSQVEVPVGKFVCDVVAYKADAAVLAVEILMSHAVGEDKGEALELPWIELKASDVLEDPMRWRPVQARLKPTTCPMCKAKRIKIEEVKTRWKLPAVHPDYVAAVAPCWSCHKDIIWYWWPGVPFVEGKPPTPIPPIVQYRHSKMYGGRYWMNVCPGCRAPQGDNFVFLATDSPFKGLPLNDTDSMKAHRNQHTGGLLSHFMDIVRRNI
jgi:hypothetical protein